MTEIAKRTGSFKSFDGAPIYFESRGEGPPIVLAYGLACSMNHWIHQVRHFSTRYQVVTFDYRGHHRSPAPENRENLNLDALARDLIELCDHLALERPSVWGHSFGVPVLIRALDMRADLASNLVFINGFASNPIKSFFGVDVSGHALRALKDGYSSFPETLRSIWKGAVSSPLMGPVSALAGGFNLALTNFKDIEVYARGVAAMDIDVFLTLYDQMIKYDGLSVLGRIDAPTLIVSGGKDGVTAPSFQHAMHERIARSELFTVPYGSHCTQLDMPDYVNMRIEKFLRETGYAGREGAGGPRAKTN